MVFTKMKIVKILLNKRNWAAKAPAANLNVLAEKKLLGVEVKGKFADMVSVYLK